MHHFFPVERHFMFHATYVDRLHTAQKPIAWGTVGKLGARRARWRYRLGDPMCWASKNAISLNQWGRATFEVGFCPQNLQLTRS